MEAVIDLAHIHTIGFVAAIEFAYHLANIVTKWLENPRVTRAFSFPFLLPVYAHLFLVGVMTIMYHSNGLVQDGFKRAIRIPTTSW